MRQSDFQRQCYIRTGGWIASNPASPRLSPGDFCSLYDGEFRPLGNVITDINIDEDVFELSEVPLNPGDWRLSDGIAKTIIDSEMSEAGGETSLATRQLIEFDRKGGFVLYGQDPYATLLLNWSQIEDDITIKLTQSQFGFREVFVITAVAEVKPWSLTIAADIGAKLETVASLGQGNLFTLLTHASCQVTSQLDIDVDARSQDRPMTFFKAKRLGISDWAQETLLARSILRQRGRDEPFIQNWIDENPFNALRENELNPTTALNYFSWSNTNLDDVEGLKPWH